MGMPPDDVEPSDLFLKLLERPKPSCTFPFPRTDESGDPVFDVRVFVLNERELGECKMAVRKWGKEKLKDGTGIIAEMDKDTLGDRLAKEILARSVHENKQIPNTEDMPGGPRYKRLFVNADSIDELTADEMAMLYGAYLTTQQKYGPLDDSFQSDAEVNEWVKRLKEGGGHFLLSLLQSHQRDALLLKLVERVSTTSSLLLSSPLENFPESWESLLEAYLAGIDSSTELAAESTDYQSETETKRVITKEEALAAAREVRRVSKVIPD